MPTAKKSKQRLVWIDCEMTGLDPERESLIEIASIVTDYDLNVLGYGPVLAIKAPAARLRAMDAWNKRTHKASGLLERVKADGVNVKDAEKRTLNFVKRYCYAGTAPLCGNSIGQDKRFLAKYMPTLHGFFSYRSVDVTSIKVLASEWYGGKYAAPQKQELHLALTDIEESIEELRHYRRTVFVKS